MDRKAIEKRLEAERAFTAEWMVGRIAETDRDIRDLLARITELEDEVGYVLDEIAHLRKTADEVENAGLTRKKFGSTEYVAYTPSAVHHLRQKADDLEGLLAGKGVGGTKAPRRDAKHRSEATAQGTATP